jgi:hypothetical protein
LPPLAFVSSMMHGEQALDASFQTILPLQFCSY